MNENIGGALTQSPHKVGIPLAAERDVDADPPALAHQTLLQVAADAIKHLELERIAGQFFCSGKSLGLPNDIFVVRGQSVIDAALHQDLHQFDVVGVDL